MISARVVAFALALVPVQIEPPLPPLPIPPLPPVPPPPDCLIPPLPPICLPPDPIPPEDDPPTRPAEIELRHDDARYVVLRWKPATDDRGIWGYRIYRDGNYIARRPANARSARLRLPCGVHRFRLEAVDTAEQTASRDARIVRRC